MADITDIKSILYTEKSLGLQEDGVIVVQTSPRMTKNGLKEVHVILKSEAVLVKSLRLTEEQEAILAKLMFRIQAVLKGRKSKYVLMNAPNDKVESIIKLLPGMRSPTVLPLAEPGWSSIHTVVEKNSFWEVIDELKANGAEGLLVVPIEKMVL